jgi:phage-related tail fiber protein
MKNTPGSWSDTSFDNPTSSYDLSNFLNPHIAQVGNSGSKNSQERGPASAHQRKDSSGMGSRPAFNPMGSAVYSTAQEMAFAQSNMALPELPNAAGNVEDPMFWGNMDFNMADVFGSAAWESMTGMDPFQNTGVGWDQGQPPAGFGA